VSTFVQKFHNPEIVGVTVDSDTAPPSSALVELGSTLRCRKLLILAGIVAGLSASASILLLMPPRYMAATTLEVQGLNENFMNMTAVDPQAGTGAYSTNSINIETQIRILQSGSLRGPVIDRLQRETTPSLPPQNGLISDARRLLHIRSDDPLESTRQAIGVANENLKVKNILGTRIIALTSESTNPDVAATFINALAADYISQAAEIHSVNAQKTGQWLAGQLEETKAKLEQAEAKLAEFVQKAGVTVVGDQETLADSKMHVLQGDLASLRAETITKKTLLDKVLNAPPEALADIIQDADLKSYLSRMNDLKRDRAVLLAKYTPEYSKVKDLDLQLGVLQAAFDKSRQNIIARYASDYDESVKREKLMTSAYTSEASTIASQSDKMAQYGMLKREVDILRLSLNSILQQSNQASVASALPADSVRVVDSAAPSTTVSSPVPATVLTEGAAGGLLMGTALAFLIERRKRKHQARKFADPGRSTALLKTRELGVIPSIEERLGPTRLLGIPIPRRLGPAPIEGGFLLKESFRMIVASLVRQDASLEHPRIVVVTSPGAGEGKTTIVSNIAKAMSEIGRRVLVINADLRRPHLDELFEMVGTPGLSDLLLSEEPIDLSYLRSLIKHQPASNIYALPAGPMTDRITRLFYSTRMQLVLESLRKQFDCVLIDTPPLLQFAEARILGRMSDGVILVLRSGTTEEGDALAARQMLFEDQITLVGAILNDFKPADNNAYRAYYYHQALKS
jgi:capsular exopolysaccharide synthesis family protein